MLQYNIPPQEISRMLRGQQYEPSGFVSRHPYIKHASSISDLVSKIIDIELGNFSRCEAKPGMDGDVLSARIWSKPRTIRHRPWRIPAATMIRRMNWANASMVRFVPIAAVSG